MIVVPVKEGENIEKALKKFKRKFEKTGVVKELRARQQFDKPSVLNLSLIHISCLHVKPECFLIKWLTVRDSLLWVFRLE